MNEKDNPNIWKEALVGFLITRAKKPDQDRRGSHYFVHMTPLIAEWESGGLPLGTDATRLNADYEIVGILPSPVGSAAVMGLVPNSQRGTNCEVLGYEIPGSTVQREQRDWEAKRQDAIKSWDEIAAEKSNREHKQSSSTD